MQVISKPYPHLIKENWMNNEDFLRCKTGINFNEIQRYCNNPQVHEHNNSLHGNYSMPVDFTEKCGWMFDYFINEKNIKHITQSLYGQIFDPDHAYINLHWDNSGTELGVHNDQKKYRWLVTGQLYVDGDLGDGVILQDDNLNEISKIPLEPNLFYAIATSMYSWHYVKPIKRDKISILVRFGKKQINTVTNFKSDCDYAIIIHNHGHYDGHYSKLGMRMANMTEAWLSNQGYSNIHMSEWRNEKSLEKLLAYCKKYYKKIVVVPSGYLGERNLLQDKIQDKDIEIITKDNINNLAEIVFNLSKYTNTRFRAGEIMLKSFNPLLKFSNTKEKVL